MNKNILNKEITNLRISDNITNKLSKNQINSVKDLWYLSRNDLKKWVFF